MTQTLLYRTRMTLRQRQVLLALSYGRTYKQIGESLGIGEDGVRVHAKAAFRKLGVTNGPEAVRVGFERGYLTPRDPS